MTPHVPLRRLIEGRQVSRDLLRAARHVQSFAKRPRIYREQVSSSSNRVRSLIRRVLIRRPLKSNGPNRRPEMSEYVLTNPRPEPTEADAAYWRQVRTPVGPAMDGVVISLSFELGTGYVRAAKSGQLYLLARNVLSQKIFDHLETGASVTFRENGHKGVAHIEA